MIYKRDLLKFILLLLFLSGFDGIFIKSSYSLPKVKMDPPPHPSQDFPVCQAIDKPFQARDILRRYLEHDPYGGRTDLIELKRVKAQNILGLTNKKSFLHKLIDIIADDVEVGATMADYANALNADDKFAIYINQKDPTGKTVFKKLIDNKAKQSLLVVIQKADIDQLDFSFDNESKRYLLSIIKDSPKRDEVVTKIVGKNATRKAFLDFIIASIGKDEKINADFLNELREDLE